MAKVFTIWDATNGAELAVYRGVALSKAAADSYVEEKMEMWEKSGARRCEHGGTTTNGGRVWITQAVEYPTLPSLPSVKGTFIIREETAFEPF